MTTIVLHAAQLTTPDTIWGPFTVRLGWQALRIALDLRQRRFPVWMGLEWRSRHAAWQALVVADYLVPVITALRYYVSKPAVDVDQHMRVRVRSPQPFATPGGVLEII